MREGLRARARRHAGHVEDVLERDRHAVQRADHGARRRLRRALARCPPRALAIKVHPRLHCGLELVDALQERLGPFHRIELARADPPSPFRRGQGRRR
jgi:hypothetical protein